MKRLDELKKALTLEFCDIEFSFHGKDCGIEPIVENSHATYNVWCDDMLKTFKSANEVLDSPMFDGKSLREIAEDIDFFYV